MAILVTGASGFVGQALIPRLLQKGHKVYGLSRHPPVAKENLFPLVGNITESNLGLEDVPQDISSVYHLAAIHTLGQTRADEIYKTNVMGTQMVLDFCLRHKINRLFFCSTAYTVRDGRNPYERSKIKNEQDIEGFKNFHKDFKVTIFKPSIILGKPDIPYFGHFIQVVLTIIKLHKRAETIRRYIEGKLRLPILRPSFRLPGNPDSTLSLICIDDVVKAMAEIQTEGIYWLVHDAPPRLRDVTEWLSEIILLDLKIEPKFDATPIEMAFQRLGAAFLPYLWGDDFKSDIKASPIDKNFIQETIKRSLL